MAHAQYHAVQPFLKVGKLGLQPGPIKQCASAEAAKRLAEKLVDDHKAAGALAFSRPGNGSADEYSEPIYLARIGEVPESDDY